MKKSYSDQIAQWEATLAAKTVRMDEILTKSGESGQTLDEAEQEEHDTLADEVKKIDAQLVRLRAAEAREKEAAVEVKGQTTTEASTARQTPSRIQVTRELPKGILFARYAMCIGASQGIAGEAIRLAKQFYPDDPGVFQLIEKTAVAGASTTGSHYIDDMVPYSVMNDFIEYLRPGSIVGKFGGPNPGGGPNYPSLNRVGFNERVSGMSTGFSAAWVGEGLPALPSAAVTYNAALLFHKLAALAVLTKEAIRFSNPAAEGRVRDELGRAVNAKMDLDFVDPAKAAVGATSPASITNGIVATTPTGTTAAKFRTDLATMIGLFATANLDPVDIVLIMSANMALQLSMMVNTLGNNEFPDITMKGGMIRGFPVIVSEHLTAVGSPSTQTIIAVKASDIYLADDGVVTVEASDQASLEMQDTSSQSGITGTGASLVSLWQNGLVGLKATREVTWKLRRSTAVRYISPAAYVAS
jgi:HK97 family phage major capsid protein